jgi:formylglycine-generating enzyme required for sulfatase activity
MSHPSKKHNEKELLDYFSDMRLIPGGSFQMGDVNGEVDERPVHKEEVSEFYMGRTPVTVAMWREYVNEMDLNMPEPPEWGWRDEDPMVNVSWDDIMGPDGNGGTVLGLAESPASG